MAGLDDQSNVKPVFDEKCGLTGAARQKIIDEQMVLGAGAGAVAGAVTGLGVPGAAAGTAVGTIFGHSLGEEMAASAHARLERQPGCPKAP